jgi:hypothetical protein
MPAMPSMSTEMNTLSEVANVRAPFRGEC